MLQGQPFLSIQNFSIQSFHGLSLQLQSCIHEANFFQKILEIIKKDFHIESLQLWMLHPSRGLQLKEQVGTQLDLFDQGDRLTQNHPQFHSIQSAFSQNQLWITPTAGCLPLLHQNKVIGLLSWHRPNPALNTSDLPHQEFLEVIGAQLALAIHNHQTYQSLNHSRQKLTQKLAEQNPPTPSSTPKSPPLHSSTHSLVDSNPVEIVGKSIALLRLLQLVDKVAPTTATVLIQGESGTGKELIARSLHFKSQRAQCPYVTLNCGALQEALLESELFGHEKGAFTGAVSQKLGLCETAHLGTLFLDEIAEMSLGIQAKLLRFLQEGEFYRIGGKRPIQVNVRVISATNRDLEKEVKENRFREDLFYRLNTITLNMPPLRQRKEDIPALIDFFLKHSRFTHQTQNIQKIDHQALDVLKAYHWPGNIRELQNTIERLKILTDHHEIRVCDLPLSLRAPHLKAEAQGINLEAPLEEVEKGHILRTLAYYHGNKTKTAQSLRITIKTLYNKLHRYGILSHHPSGSSLESIKSDGN